MSICEARKEKRDGGRYSPIQPALCEKDWRRRWRCWTTGGCSRKSGTREETSPWSFSPSTPRRLVMRHITSLVCANRKGAELPASLLMSYAAQNGRISIGMGIPSLQRKGVHSGSKPSARHGPLRPLFNIGVYPCNLYEYRIRSISSKIKISCYGIRLFQEFPL